MQGGFSIREYASRMRSINAVNSWPFDETSSEETVKSLLPPITVMKFTWWLDEVEYILSDSSKNYGKTKKKRLKKEETSSRIEDQDMDDYVKVKSVKGKMKTQKKRSIVEIFAVAPPVERVISEDEEEEDNIDEDAKKKKKKSGRDVMLRKALSVVKKIKKKKSQKPVELSQSLPSKENVVKLKPQAQSKARGEPSSSFSKELEHDPRDCVSILKTQQPSRQHLDAYKKTMSCESFKLIIGNQHPGLDMRGILKNHGESLVPPRQSMKHIVQGAVQKNYCNRRKANKHVTFSKKDEILRLSRKSTHSVEYNSDVQKVCGSDMGNIGNAGGVGKDLTNVESEDAFAGIEKEVEQLITCIVNSTDFTKKNNEEEPSRRPEASDRSSLHYLNKDWPHNAMDVCAPGYFCSPLDGHYNNPNSNVIRNSLNFNCRRLNKDLGTPGPISPPLCCDGCLRTYNESSVSSKELMKTHWSSPEGCQTGNICGRRGINEDFVGLPLNSQGELVTLNPNAEREVNQMKKSSVSSERRSLNYRGSSMDQLNLFPIESCVKENPISVIPSRLDIAESQSESQTNLDMDFLKMNFHSVLDSEHFMFKGGNQVHKIHENEKTQSTMRLMGKEFKVDGTGVQGFEEEHVWKNKKHNINDLHSGNNFNSNVLLDQNELSSEKLRDPTLYCPSEIAINQRSESKYALPHYDHQTNSIFVARKIHPTQNMYTAPSPNNFSEVYNNESLFSEPFTSGYGSPFSTLDLPAPRDAYQEACPSMKIKQNLPHTLISAMRFPFTPPNLDGHAVSSRSRRSSVNRAPLCFRKEATQLSNTHSYRTLGHNNPYMKSVGSSLGTDSSVCLKLDDSQMFFPLSSGSSSEMCVAPMPYYPRILMQKRGNSKKFKERIKSRIGSRVLGDSKELEGQVPSLSTIPFQPFKMPTLGPHENIQCANQDERIISPWLDSHIDTARTGPVKLSGGVMHILKARQQKD